MFDETCSTILSISVGILSVGVISASTLGSYSSSHRRHTLLFELSAYKFQHTMCSVTVTLLFAVSFTNAACTLETVGCSANRGLITENTKLLARVHPTHRIFWTQAGTRADITYSRCFQHPQCVSRCNNMAAATTVAATNVIPPLLRLAGTSNLPLHWCCYCFLASLYCNCFCPVSACCRCGYCLRLHTAAAAVAVAAAAVHRHYTGTASVFSSAAAAAAGRSSESPCPNYRP